MANNKISRRSVLPLLGTGLLLPLITGAKSNDDTHAPATDTSHPEALFVGACVGVCAPAGASHSPQEVADFIQLLGQLGFKVKTAGKLNAHYGYLSDTDEARAQAFMDLVQDQEVKAIFFTRGGWGCARILPLLDFKAIHANPKIMMGFSDLTALLVAISHKTGLVTFHGPNGNASWGAFSWASIEQHLMKGSLSKMYCSDSKMYPTAPITLSSGKAKGELFGGNLTVLTSMLGSMYLPDWKGKILFLEDVKEEPYRIDRMLTQWKLNGVFDQISGLVLGQFRKCVPEEPEWSFTLNEVFEHHFKDAPFPVFSGFLCGHIEHKFTLPIGQLVEIDSTDFSITPLKSSVRKR
jgi:muramoyltetrapeptide carboxypeptidase